MSEIIANNIKYLRRMNGLTQEQFSRKIGIKRSLLGAYEEGRANPNLENLTNIAKIFGTTVDNLIKNDIRTLREKQGVPLPQPAARLLEPNEPQPPKPLATLIDKYYQHPADAPPAIPFTPPRPAPPKPAPSAPPPERLQKPAAPRISSIGPVVWVSAKDNAEYLTGYAYPDFLDKLPELALPMLPAGKFRAFETGADFPLPGATVVGEFAANWYDIRDGHHYVIILHKQGVLYRRVYNHVKIKGTVLLLSDLPGVQAMEVPIKDVLEFWAARQFISPSMPEPKAALPLERLASLADEMQREIQSLRT